MTKKVFMTILMMGLLAARLCWSEDAPGLRAGISAPDFSAETYDGRTVKLSEIYSRGPVVLVFYRGGWCMYCNRQLQEFQSRLIDFSQQNASIIAVSVDLPQNAAKTAEEKQLGFTVITDPGAELLKLYNSVEQVSDELAEVYKRDYGIDLQAASGRSDHVIAVPAVYVIDPFGKIVFAYANRDYKIRPSLDEILHAVKALNGQSPMAEN